jgi:FkbM family methyltransferase
VESHAAEWLREAGWRILPPSDKAAERETHLLLVEASDRDPSGCKPWDRTAEVAAARRPWVVVVDADGLDVPALEGRLAAAGYAFMWFDGTYRYYPAAERSATLMPAFTEPLPLEKLTPPYVFSDARIAMTLRCRDCDTIPKVADAGRVIEDADGGRIQVMHNGIRVVADGYGGAWTTRLIGLCHGHHEPQEERLFHEVVSRLPADATMIEIGGYWAYYSLWFLSGGHGRRSIVVEPDPAHLEVGRRNAALNGLAPEFLAGFVGGSAAPPRYFQTESSGLVELPCLSVPQLLAEHSMDQLDLLHCDAQGAELAVLENCRELLRSGTISWVFVSTHAHQISGDPLNHQRCLLLLRGLGGTVVAEHDIHESFSGDGLIVAWFGPGEPDLPVADISRNRYAESMFRNPLYDLAAERGEAVDAAAGEARAAKAEARVAEAGAALAAAETVRAAAEFARGAAEARAAKAEARVAEAEAALAAAETVRAAAESRAAKRQALLVQTKAARDAALREVEALHSSTSWRATAPLRFLSGILRRTR